MMVTVDKMELWHYWHPRDVSEVRFRSDQEYLDAFMELYSEAVRSRLRSHRPIGTMLSGGLDSGSISILAARELAKRGQSLFAFSSLPVVDVTKSTPQNRCGDERLYIEATCRFADNIDLTYIKAENITPLAAFDRALAIHDRPHGNANYNWILKLLETAQQQQIGTMLDGWGAISRFLGQAIGISIF
jgi:asparagine synthase (glutamine-hydrolysing)